MPIQSYCMALVSSPAVVALRPPYQKYRSRPCLMVIRSHSHGDHEGRSRHDIVDANLRFLVYRIEEVKMKERLERCYQTGKLGWNYAQMVPGNKSKRSLEPLQYIELASTVGSTFGLTILGGTLVLCLASILVHLNQLLTLGF